MRIHREGRKIILLITVSVVLLLIIVMYALPGFSLLRYIINGLGLLIILFSFSFFRVPSRKADYSAGKVFSGADGKVIVVEKVFEDEFLKDERLQVSVFMRITDVHVNYVPLSGMVKYKKHHHGKFVFAWFPKASTLNERTTVVIENEKYGPVLIRQIAGAFARRIVCHPNEGDILEQGSELGIIKFGSRMDIFLPLHANIQVILNQRVRGGETIIALL